MRGYRRSSLGPDLVAGLTLWALVVPEAMAYAAIALLRMGFISRQFAEPVIGMITPRKIWHLRQLRVPDFWLALSACLGVVLDFEATVEIDVTAAASLAAAVDDQLAGLVDPCPTVASAVGTSVP